MVLKRERIEKPYVKKDGSISTRPRIFYKCHTCGEESPLKNTQIDHVTPVGPTPGSKLAPPNLSWDTFISRLFCGPENLATICKECHSQKTKAEMSERWKRLAELRRQEDDV